MVVSREELFKNYKTLPWGDIESAGTGSESEFFKFKTVLTSVRNSISDEYLFYTSFLIEATVVEGDGFVLEASDNFLENRFSDFPEQFSSQPKKYHGSLKERHESERLLLIEFDCKTALFSYFPVKSGTKHKLFVLLIYPVLFNTAERLQHLCDQIAFSSAGFHRALRMLLPFRQIDSLKQIEKGQLDETLDLLQMGFEQAFYDMAGRLLFKENTSFYSLYTLKKFVRFFFDVNIPLELYNARTGGTIIPFGHLLFPFATTSTCDLEQLINAYSLYCSISGLYLADDGWLYRRVEQTVCCYQRVMSVVQLPSRFTLVQAAMEQVSIALYGKLLLPPLALYNRKYLDKIEGYLRDHLPRLVFSNFLVQDSEGTVYNLVESKLIPFDLDEFKFKVRRGKKASFPILYAEYFSSKRLPRFTLGVKLALNGLFLESELKQRASLYVNRRLNRALASQFLAKRSPYALFTLLQRYEELDTHLLADGLDSLMARLERLTAEPQRGYSSDDLKCYVAFILKYSNDEAVDQFFWVEPTSLESYRLIGDAHFLERNMIKNLCGGYPITVVTHHMIFDKISWVKYSTEKPCPASPRALGDIY